MSLSVMYLYLFRGTAFGSSSSNATQTMPPLTCRRKTEAERDVLALEGPPRQGGWRRHDCALIAVDDIPKQHDPKAIAVVT